MLSLIISTPFAREEAPWSNETDLDLPSPFQDGVAGTQWLFYLFPSSC